MPTVASSSSQVSPPTYSLPATLAGCLVVVLIFVAVQLGLTVLLSRYLLPTTGQALGETLALGAENGTVMAASVLLTLPIMTGVLALAIRWRQARVGSYLALSLGQAGWQKQRAARSQAFNFKLWLVFFGGLLGLNLLVDVVTRKFNRDPLVFMDSLVVSAKPLWLLIVAMVIAAPLYEELMFRGFMWSGLAASRMGRHRLGAWGASLVTSVIFAAIHLQYGVVEMAEIVLLGLLFATARAKTGALYLPIALHVTNNGLAMVQYFS